MTYQVTARDPSENVFQLYGPESIPHMSSADILARKAMAEGKHVNVWSIGQHGSRIIYQLEPGGLVITGDKPRTIDITPTWAALLPVFRAVLDNGTDEGKRMAWEELARMAEAADQWNAHCKGPQPVEPSENIGSIPSR